MENWGVVKDWDLETKGVVGRFYALWHFIDRTEDFGKQVLDVEGLAALMGDAVEKLADHLADLLEVAEWAENNGYREALVEEIKKKKAEKDKANLAEQGQEA